MRSWLLAAAAAASTLSTSMGSRAVYSALQRLAEKVMLVTWAFSLRSDQILSLY
jgi:hypothetical protein